MKILRKHKRKHFFPIGILTLVLLPLIFFYFIAEKLKHGPHTMEIDLHPDSTYIELQKQIEILSGLPPRTSYLNYQFTNNENANSQIFPALRNNFRTIASHNDTAKGIHAHFSREMSYNTFVQVLDLLFVENIYRFSLEGADLWVLPPKKDSAEIQIYETRSGKLKTRKVPKLKNNYNITICGGCIADFRKLQIKETQYQLPAGMESPYVYVILSLVIFSFLYNVVRIRRFKKDLN